MSEEEIIEKINWAIHVNEMTKSINGDNTHISVNVLQGLLDLYKAEQEKNREVINYCKRDLAFKRRLEKVKDTIDNYNIGRFDTSQSILNILEE